MRDPVDECGSIKKTFFLVEEELDERLIARKPEGIGGSIAVEEYLRGLIVVDRQAGKQAGN